MKEKIIGIYEIGHEKVKLLLREGTGGDFACVLDDQLIPIIKIGADDSWDYVFTALLHESGELIRLRTGVRYTSNDDVSYSTERFVFMYDHKTFGNMCTKNALFIVSCLNDLKKAYNEWHKKRR